MVLGVKLSAVSNGPRIIIGKRDDLLLGVCDDVALQVVALHQRLVVEVGHAHVFNVAADIKNLIIALHVTESCAN